MAPHMYVKILKPHMGQYLLHLGPKPKVQLMQPHLELYVGHAPS